LGDAPGDGWLRLTNTSRNKLGHVLLDGSFPSDMGVSVEFDFKIWANTISDRLADVLSMFLFDGDPDSTFQLGRTGQYLGYIPMKPAYLGIGIDIYGYFGGTLIALAGNPSAGMRLHSIAVGNANYQYIAGTPAYLQDIQGLPTATTLLGYTTATPTRPDDATIYRRIKIGR
jgi:hypothetical protein